MTLLLVGLIVGFVVGFTVAIFTAALALTPMLRQVKALEARHERDREMVDEALAVLSRQSKGTNGVPAPRPLA
jgi:uncharacterized membrane protein